MAHLDYINTSRTCSAPLLDQEWVVHDIVFSKFHALQLCPLELHDRAIQDTEYAEQTWVPPRTAIWMTMAKRRHISIGGKSITNHTIITPNNQTRYTCEHY
jgi:hypothetical protein